MSQDSKWLRLNIDWDDCEWLSSLSEGGQLAWIRLLCHYKRDLSAGSVKALSPAVAAKRWCVSLESATVLIEAATAHGALVESDGRWTLTGWDTYQNPESLRKARYRESHSEAPELSHAEDGQSQDVHGQSRTPCRVTMTMTETLTKTGTDIKQEKIGSSAVAPSPSAPKQTDPRVMPRPSKDEVAAYFREHGRSGETARRFWNHFEAVGWKVGRNPMKQWKRAADNWQDYAPRGSPTTAASIREVLNDNPFEAKQQPPEVQSLGA